MAFVAEELKAVFDPRGGYWDDGQYVPSVCAAIGGIIEHHMTGIGAISSEVASVTVAARHCPKCQVGELHRSEGCWHCRSCDYTKC